MQVTIVEGSVGITKEQWIPSTIAVDQTVVREKGIQVETIVGDLQQREIEIVSKIDHP